ncbi:MAG: 5-formyltetrahydrofolate cyclo-ligase [Desulfurivibrionaceae bacterium]|nr:5-formyltetrahydrofolate cyclo-ligase [Desulfurivibrionaceae bacterium]
MESHSQQQKSRALWRREILARRDQMAAPQRQEKSLALAARLEALACFRQARTMLFYVSFRSEVETRSLMRQALARGITVAAPLTRTRDKELQVFAVTDLDHDLVPGYQGIREPDPHRCRLLEPAALDLVIVPGSLFDLHGGRMGYGGGYYDRFLARRAPQAIRVGLCFELQLVAEVPMAAHDQYLDYVVTEARVVETGRRLSLPAQPLPGRP